MMINERAAEVTTISKPGVESTRERLSTGAWTEESGAGQLEPSNDTLARMDLVATLEASLRQARAEYQQLEADHAQIQREYTRWEADHTSLLSLNERLAQVNAATAELMAELEEKNRILYQANRELARANAHAAELVAIVELREEENRILNRALSAANARSADLIAEGELRMDELASLNSRLREEIRERERVEETLRERTEDLEARNRDLDAFSHTVAHDLRGPLGPIIGFAELLQAEFTELEEEEINRCLRAIAESGQKMANITDALLLLAGLRDVKIQMRPVDLASTVTESVARLEYMIEEYQADVVLHEDWPPALGYGPWVEEVWVNYLSNALKYGGRPPRVELGATPEADGAVRYWVRDNGVGLTAEEQARLFTPFTRLSQVDAKGYGLGLSIVQRIVEKTGGQCGVKSEVGRGSVFSFTLPRAGQPEQAPPG